ncbi:MAG TPA: ATP-binding protein [Alphaproteobacteria bacterium]|nr:ATP-binding protein [Alphaproteobacteria bacterium]
MRTAAARQVSHRAGGLDPEAILSQLAFPVLVVDSANQLLYLNGAGEDFFAASASASLGRSLAEMLVPDSPLLSLIDQVRASGSSLTEHGVTLDSPRTGPRAVSVDLGPGPNPGEVVIALRQRSIAGKIDRQLTHRHAARSVTAMAAMLAHEVKNPLSGIRGAAQLLEQNAAGGDLELTRLICEEADRIVALVDRMEMFSDQRPIERGPVNIHEAMEHARRIASAGFARVTRIVERYDPSLPPVLGNRDLLIQAFLNLLKNAAEAVPVEGGEIVLTTQYQQGVRIAPPGSEARLSLPILASIQDNGSGIADDLRAHLFDPFVTTKASGKGLGLALVAKIVGDHGGIVEFESEPRRTIFRIMLPAAAVAEGGAP